MKRYHFDESILASHYAKLGHLDHERIRGVTSNDAGRYTCHECGCAWQAEAVRAYWPIGFRWSTDRRCRSWFRTHGWEIGSDGIERRVFAWALHLGPLLVSFGRRK